jgi:uncharacterized membrane protein YGL010W
MSLMGKRGWDEWIRQYAASHQHPVNRTLHAIGIPMIALSLLVAPFGFFLPMAWMVAVAGFVIGWILQFIGHFFEGKPPEFLRDWRFLLVGLRWWFAKMAGRA